MPNFIHNFFSKIFRRKNFNKESPAAVLAKAQPGFIVKIKFVHPRNFGVIDPSGRLTRRFDPEDLDTCQFAGTLLRTRVDHGITLLEIATHKMVNGERRERIYTIMLDEIKELRILQ